MRPWRADGTLGDPVTDAEFAALVSNGNPEWKGPVYRGKPGEFTFSEVSDDGINWRPIDKTMPA